MLFKHGIIVIMNWMNTEAKCLFSFDDQPFMPEIMVDSLANYVIIAILFLELLA